MSWYTRVRERFASDPELVAIRQRLEARRQRAREQAKQAAFWAWIDSRKERIHG